MGFVLPRLRLAHRSFLCRTSIQLRDLAKLTYLLLMLEALLLPR